MAMTEEEFKQLARMQQLRNAGKMPPTEGPMTPNVINQGSITPEMRALANQDFTNRQSQLAQQMRYGRELLSSQAPRGKEVGGIYAAPTWSENLAGATEKLMGGYQMGQANKGYADVKKGTEERDYNRGLIQAMEDARVQQDRDTAEEQRLIGNQNETTRIEQGQAGIDLRGSELEQRKEEARIAQQNVIADRDWEEEQARLDRENRIKIEELKNIADLSGDPILNEGDYPDDVLAVLNELPAGERKTARINLTAFDSANLLMPEVDKLLKEGKGYTAGQNLAVDTVEWLTPGPLEKSARGKANTAVYTPEQKQAMGKIANTVEAIKRARTGANLTAMEDILGEDWNPAAKGIGLEEARRRLVSMMEWLNTERNAFGLPAGNLPGSWQDSDASAPGPNDIPVGPIDDEEDLVMKYLGNPGG